MRAILFFLVFTSGLLAQALTVNVHCTDNEQPGQFVSIDFRLANANIFTCTALPCDNNGTLAEQAVQTDPVATGPNDPVYYRIFSDSQNPIQSGFKVQFTKNPDEVQIVPDGDTGRFSCLTD